MSFDLLIDSLSKRISFHVMRTILHHHNIKVGRNWDGTIEKFKYILDEGSEEKKDKLIAILNSVYLEHLITGDRSVHFFKEDKQTIINIMEYFNNYKITESLFKSNYPYLLDDVALNDTENNTFLVDVINCEEKQVLIFCSKRFIRERFDIPPRGDLSEYSEIIGIKRHNKQSFDIIVLHPLTETIEIRVDVGSKVPADDRKTSFINIKRAFQELVTGFTGTQFILNNVVNLFPVINKLYLSEGEGRVCELAFTTDGTSSNKHEKMRQRHECLRSEAYHKGGFDAVEGRITAYRIAVTWEHGTGTSLVTKPELFLAGSATMLSQEEPILTEAIITDCAGKEDYNFVISKLNSFLEQ